MNNSKLIIYGTSVIAQLAYEYFSTDSNYHICGFTIENQYKTTNRFCGLEVYPFEEILNRCPPDEYDMFIAIGSMKLNTIREIYYKKAKDLGYRLASYVSSKASVYSNVDIGDNCFILPFTVIQPYAQISNSVFIWDTSMIGHHCKISNHVFIASAKIAGLTTIDNNCFIGLGSLISDNIVISEYNYIAMGSVINKNTKSNGIYRGNPAKRFQIDSISFYINGVN